MTYQKTPYTNFFLQINGQTIFIECEDATEHMAAGGVKDATYIAEGTVEATLTAQIDIRDVVHVCMDGAANCKLAGSILQNRHPHISATTCFAHVTNSFFSDVGKISEVADVIAATGKIIDFCQNHHAVHAIYKSECKNHLGKELALIKTSGTRFAGHFMECHRLRRVKPALMAVAASAAVIQGAYTDRTALDLIGDFDFWEALDHLLRELGPAYKLLRLADGSRPQMSKLYPYIQQ